MLTVSAEQNGREITEADLVDAFEDWSWMGQREEGGHTGYRHYQLFMQATSRIRLSTVRARLEKRHGIHVNYIEPRRYSVASCVAYVSKKETRQAGRSSTAISICTKIRASEPIWRNCVTPW